MSCCLSKVNVYHSEIDLTEVQVSGHGDIYWKNKRTEGTSELLLCQTKITWKFMIYSVGSLWGLGFCIVILP